MGACFRILAVGRFATVEWQVRLSRSFFLGFFLSYKLIVFVFIVAVLAGFLGGFVSSWFFSGRDDLLAAIELVHAKLDRLSVHSGFHSIIEDSKWRVLSVSDGDSMRVERDGKVEPIRLEGIDCPEDRQAFGKAATEFVSQLVSGQVVTVNEKGRDKYGRILADVILADGRSLNEELLRVGLAWHYKQYSKDETLARLEAEARLAKRGLWTDENPQAPWDFRRRSR